LGIVGGVTHHLEPVPEPTDEVSAPPGGNEAWDTYDDDLAPLRRPSWWRWVAIVVVVAMVVATPVAYALYVLFR
jgi:hypothetical protein